MAPRKLLTRGTLGLQKAKGSASSCTEHTRHGERSQEGRCKAGHGRNSIKRISEMIPRYTLARDNRN